MSQIKTRTSKSRNKPPTIGKIFNDYLFVTKYKRSLIDVFLWWERKRIVFNAFILSLCLICYVIQNISMSTTSYIFTKRELILFFVTYNIAYSAFCVIEFFS